jgi:phosphoglycerate kinase
MERELRALHAVLEQSARSLVAVLGGAKVADKIGVVRRFLEITDELLIVGAMALPFLVAQCHRIGASRCAPEDVEVATAVSVGAPQGRLQLPVDLVVADAVSAGAPRRRLDGLEVPEGWFALDIGPRTALHYAEVIQRAGTAFCNGPMGDFELVPFANGTTRVAEAVATTAAASVAGGGETVAALRDLGLAEQIDHVSTGGGATLELIEGRELPGVQALITTEHIPALAGAPGSRTPT